MKQLSFDATISALDAETSVLDVETSAFGAVTSAITRRSFDATISALDAETLSLDAETSSLSAATSPIARSYRRYRRRVSGDIGDCGVGITPQMCNRVTNHGDMSTFSKPEHQLYSPSIHHHHACVEFTFFHQTYIFDIFRWHLFVQSW